MKNTYDTPVSDSLIETVRNTVLGTRGQIDEAKKVTASAIADLTNHTVKKTKDGNFRVGREFFYRHGKTSSGHAASVSKVLTAAGVKHTVVDHGEVNNPFRGGESTWRNSHFWADIKVHPDAKLTEGVEPIEELSKRTLGSYAKVAMADRESKLKQATNLVDVGRAVRDHDREAADKYFDKASRLSTKAVNRKRGAVAAINKLAAEEVEPIQELSKATLGRYIKKSVWDTQDKRMHQISQFKSAADMAAAGIDSAADYHMKAGIKTGRKIIGRENGISKAVDKLTKESKED